MVKARDNGRFLRRPERRRTPEELAREYEEALRWRARLRAEAAGEAVSAEASETRERSERSRFAAAITRAEFGRFYFKEERRRLRERSPKRSHNGQAE
jgi:hypothetical protein